ncbi:hypothetical protein IMSAGC008_02031 [Muribaculaceae bacterium]|nr:hypothetical protein IMSAGC008_02031 [Muribaculaceae bacterium]
MAVVLTVPSGDMKMYLSAARAKAPPWAAGRIFLSAAVYAVVVIATVFEAKSGTAVLIMPELSANAIVPDDNSTEDCAWKLPESGVKLSNFEWRPSSGLE